MTIYETLRKNLTPEEFTKVTDALGDEFDFDLVPRARLNKVIGQRNALRKQITEGSQPPDSAGKAGGDDEDDSAGAPAAEAKKPVDAAALRKAFEKEKTEAVQAVKIQYAAIDKLRAAGAIDAELIWNGGLIDQSKVALDATGAVTGIDELVSGLKTSKVHLFGKKQDEVPSGTGKEGEDGFKSVTNRGEFLKLAADKQYTFKQTNPELFKRFMTE